MTIDYLKDGITGFSNYNVVEITLQNTKDFLKHIYDFLINNNGKLLHREFNITTKNFYFVEVKVAEIDFYILLNAFKPVLAFANKVEPFNIDFIDLESTCNLGNKYNIMSKKELESIDLADFVKELNDVEKIMINKWKPERVGDLIFNFWD